MALVVENSLQVYERWLPTSAAMSRSETGKFQSFDVMSSSHLDKWTDLQYRIGGTTMQSTSLLYVISIYDGSDDSQRNTIPVGTLPCLSMACPNVADRF